MNFTFTWILDKFGFTPKIETFDFPTKKPVAKKATKVAKAKELLAKTDWAMVADVGLANQDAFVSYRLNLRNLVRNPVADAVFEAEPKAVWS